MKTLLITTDFSANSAHAVEYGYKLAKQLKANILLCNAVIIPAEIPQAGIIVWPMDETDKLMNDSAEELKRLKMHLEHHDTTDTFRPEITFANEPGTVSEVVNGLASSRDIELVVMATHGKNGLSWLLLGNHGHIMIEETTKPLLLVPSISPVRPIRKIAFATDLTNSKDDLEIIYSLIPMAKQLNAEILLTHITDERFPNPKIEQWVKDLSDKANYPNIYYRLVKNAKLENGLDWLCEHGQVDVLAMVHRKHGFFDKLFNGSHTQKMAGHVNVPLLVFPVKE